MKNDNIKIGRAIFVVVVWCLMIIGGSASAQEKFPTKPINFIIAFSAGGGQDLVARTLQPHLQKALGQSVIVINRPGAGGSIGFNEVAKAPPDGYTIGQASPSLGLLKYTVKGTNIAYTNYEPIIFGGYASYGILVRKDAPWNTWKEFHDYAKASPKKLRVGNSGHRGNGHIVCIGIENAAGLDFIHVPYKGVAPSFQEVLGGHIEAICGGVTDTLHLIKGDKLKFLAIAAPERSKVIPDTPTFKELGMDLEFLTFYGWMGPKGLPKERVTILYNAFKTAMESKEFGDFCDAQGVTISIKGPEEFAKFWEQDDKKWKELTAIGGIRPE